MYMYPSSWSWRLVSWSRPQDSKVASFTMYLRQMSYLVDYTIPCWLYNTVQYFAQSICTGLCGIIVIKEIFRWDNGKHGKTGNLEA